MVNVARRGCLCWEIISHCKVADTILSRTKKNKMTTSIICYIIKKIGKYLHFLHISFSCTITKTPINHNPHVSPSQQCLSRWPKTILKISCTHASIPLYLFVCVCVCMQKCQYCKDNLFKLTRQQSKKLISLCNQFKVKKRIQK